MFDQDSRIKEGMNYLQLSVEEERKKGLEEGKQNVWSRHKMMMVSVINLIPPLRYGIKQELNFYNKIYSFLYIIRAYSQTPSKDESAFWP